MELMVHSQGQKPGEAGSLALRPAPAEARHSRQPSEDLAVHPGVSGSSSCGRQLQAPKPCSPRGAPACLGTALGAGPSVHLPELTRGPCPLLHVPEPSGPRSSWGLRAGPVCGPRLTELLWQDTCGFSADKIPPRARAGPRMEGWVSGMPQARASQPTKPQVPADLVWRLREVLPRIVRWWPESEGFVETSVAPLFMEEASPSPWGLLVDAWATFPETGGTSSPFLSTGRSQELVGKNWHSR